MNLQALSMIELKALAYDQIAQAESCQRFLAQLNQEIALRFNASPQSTESNNAVERKDNETENKLKIETNVN